MGNFELALENSVKFYALFWVICSYSKFYKKSFKFFSFKLVKGLPKKLMKRNWIDNREFTKYGYKFLDFIDYKNFLSDKLYFKYL